MPKLPGISHQRAIKAFQKAGLAIEEFKNLL